MHERVKEGDSTDMDNKETSFDSAIDENQNYLSTNDQNSAFFGKTNVGHSQEGFHVLSY